MGASDDLPTFLSDATCLRKGLCPVTTLRDQGPELLESHSLYYEQHGPPSAKGNEEEMKKLNKIVFIMGLNGSCFVWEPQVRWFGHGGENGDCTALVFDNRGVGNSEYPRGPYSTSAMAEDVICLLDTLGWTGERELTVVGVSLGGMIAQELAYRIPKRIASLVLAVTHPGGSLFANFPPLRGLLAVFKLLGTTDWEKNLPAVLSMAFPTKWLNETARSDPRAAFNGNTPDNKQRRTNFQVQSESFVRRMAITRPQRMMGHISQMIAAMTHRVQPKRLVYIAANIPKIAIVTGDDDLFVHPSGSERLKKAMDSGLDEAGRKRVEYIKWNNTGHGLQAQHEEEFNALVERCLREGQSAVRAGFKGRDI